MALPMIVERRTRSRTLLQRGRRAAKLFGIRRRWPPQSGQRSDGGVVACTGPPNVDDRSDGWTVPRRGTT
jgi:hypothetical protein